MALRVLTPAFPALVLLSGCAPDADVIARVGGRAIRRDEVIATAGVLAGRLSVPPESVKAGILEAIVQRELMLRAAQHDGLYRDTLFLDFQRTVEEQMLRERMIGDLAGARPPVSDAEVAELHRWRDRETRARVIFTPSHGQAAAALAQVRRGADFAGVANQFNPPGFTPPGGDVGFVAPGFLQQPLDDVVRTGKVGETFGPIDVAPQGAFVVRIEERRPRQGQPLEAERSLLTEVVRQRKQRLALVRAVERLKAEYSLAVRTGAPQEMVARVIPMALQGGTTPTLTEAERAMVLVDYRDGAYTLGDAFSELSGGSVPRPNFNSTPAVEHWLESRALDRIIIAESRVRRFHDEPAIERVVRERVNDYLIEAYVNREIVQRVFATDADARAVYLGDSGQNLRLREAKLQWVALIDSAAAAQLVGGVAQVGGLREAVAVAGLRVPVRNETVTFPAQNPLWITLEPMLQALSPGQVAGPLPIAGRWMLLQMVAKSLAPGDYEKLPDATRQALQHQATEAMQSARLKAITDSLRREFPVTIYGERLRKLALPERLALPGQGQGQG